MHKPKIVNLITKILLTLAASKTIESASKGPITHAAWSPLCTLSKDKQKLYNRANKLQDDISNFFQTAAKASIKATIVAVKLNSADAMKAAIGLQAKIKADVTAKMAAAEQCRTIATAVTMRAAYLHGRIAEFIEMMTAMRGKNNEHACLSKQGDGTDTAAGETTNKQQATCKLLPEELTKHSEELTELTDDGYPKLTLQTGLTTNEQGGNSNANCIFLTNTGSELNANGGFAEALPLAAGYLLRKEDMSANSNQAINQLKNADETANAKSTVRPYVELWKAFKQLKNCEAMFSPPYTLPSAQTLLESTEVKTALKNQFLRKEGQYEDSKDRKDVDPIIKRLYKPDDEHYPKKFWQETAKKDTPQAATGKAELSKLDDIVTEEELAQVLSYYTNMQIQNLHKELKEAQEKASQANQNDAATKAAEDACNKLVGEEKCHADKKCSYETEGDGSKKCKYNATKATANGVPTTQAQTGETKTATPNCASHTEKSKCEEENKGKTTPVCGWRIGKDGEPDQDKEMCRNGSFLVGKQFALSMISAAFVALLF